ncbi:MAG: hypothetical protein FWG47_03160 [Propionibacteriaceae bacterium]|nr:hypothetical protein [Propionibacteriaceae bacterium]
MAPIRSVTWDRFSLLWCICGFFAAAMGLVALIVYGWPALVFNTQISGVMLPSGIFAILLGSFALTYARVSKWSLVFNDLGIEGVLRDECLDFSQITKWEFVKGILVLWPIAGAIPAPRFLKPFRFGVPAGAVWVAVEANKVSEIAVLLAEKIPLESDTPTLPARVGWF